MFLSFGVGGIKFHNSPPRKILPTPMRSRVEIVLDDVIKIVNFIRSH